MSIFDKPDWPELVRAKRRSPNRVQKARNTELHGRMWRTYAMALSDIQHLHRLQDGRCANPGCRAPIQPFGKSRAVDHCHKTGKVRGMLCKACNWSLGLMLDDPKRILGLATYLEGNQWAPADFLAKLTAQQQAPKKRRKKIEEIL